jgi:ABC-type multidrug transport system fused ATPase/permease subunit
MNFDLISNDELLSRFSNDLTVLDTNLPFSFKILFERLAVIIVAFAAVSAMNISFIAVLILGVIVCIGIVK